MRLFHAAYCVATGTIGKSKAASTLRAAARLASAGTGNRSSCAPAWLGLLVAQGW